MVWTGMDILNATPTIAEVGLIQYKDAGVPSLLLPHAPMDADVQK